MSFSNTDTGDKPADPYKAVNKTEPELKEKIEDLVNFIESCKYGMMTTRIESSGLLVSRCMALAAKVCLIIPSLPAPSSVAAGTWILIYPSCVCRKVAASTYSSTPTLSPARPTT